MIIASKLSSNTDEEGNRSSLFLDYFLLKVFDCFTLGRQTTQLCKDHASEVSATRSHMGEASISSIPCTHLELMKSCALPLWCLSSEDLVQRCAGQRKDRFSFIQTLWSPPTCENKWCASLDSTFSNTALHLVRETL